MLFTWTVRSILVHCLVLSIVSYLYDPYLGKSRVVLVFDEVLFFSIFLLFLIISTMFRCKFFNNIGFFSMKLLNYYCYSYDSVCPKYLIIVRGVTNLDSSLQTYKLVQFDLIFESSRLSCRTSSSKRCTVDITC